LGGERKAYRLLNALSQPTNRPHAEIRQFDANASFGTRAINHHKPASSGRGNG
jgi:hypothetical protein